MVSILFKVVTILQRKIIKVFPLGNHAKFAAVLPINVALGELQKPLHIADHEFEIESIDWGIYEFLYVEISHG